jgi:N-acetylneuraminate synthase
MNIVTIAEIGLNHNGSIELARQLIDMAVASGFDYVKFQKRDPELATPKHKRDVIRSTPWGDMKYIDYRYKVEFSEIQYSELFEYCDQKDISMFASVWDIKSAEFMKDFTYIVKIPSAKITDMALLDYCNENFDLRMMSTGMSTENEIDQAVDVLDPDIIFHTNSSYPCKSEDLRLLYIKHLKKKYPEKIIGYSGHEFGLGPTFSAVCLGAEIIERHVTLNHEMWGSDQKSSVDPVGMIKLVRGIRDIEKTMTGDEDRICYLEETGKRDDLRC